MINRDHLISGQNNAEAILWSLGGTALFSLLFVSAKFFGSGALIWQILFFRYLIGFFIMAGTAWFSPWERKVSPRWHLHLMRALVGGAAGSAAIYAAAKIPVADAAAIGLLDGVIGVLLGMWIFRELVSGHRWLAIIFCLIGAGIVVFGKGAFQGVSFLYFPMLVAFIGAFFGAFESVLIRTLASREDRITVLIHVNFFGALLFSIPAFLTWGETETITKLSFCFLGPIALIGQYCNIRAFQVAELSIVAPVAYSWIIFAAVIGFFVFDEPLSLLTVGGSALILLGGFLLVQSPEKTG